MESPLAVLTQEGEMMWFLMLLVLFVVVFIGRYGLYRLFCSRNWRWNGNAESRPKSFACFYGRHTWKVEREMYSCAKVCSVCQTPTNELQLERLEYERRLWREQASKETTDLAKQRYIRVRLLEWNRTRQVDGVMRASDSH